MLPGHAVKTTIGIVLGLASLNSIWLVPVGPHQLQIIEGILILGLLLYLWGSTNYAFGKGHSILWVLAALVPLLGLLALILLPDKFEQRKFGPFVKRFQTPPPRPPVVPIIIVVLAALGAGWGVYRYAGPLLAPAPKLPATPITVEEATHQAVAVYPQLGVLNSPLNREFRARYARYQATNKDYFKDPNWPLTLAAECQAAVQSAPPPR